MKRPPIYVVMNRHRIAANRKAAREDRFPVVRVTRGLHGTPMYCDRVIFHGPSELLNGLGEAVMPCGATIALRTEGAVTMVTEGQLDAHLEACSPIDVAA